MDKVNPYSQYVDFDQEWLGKLPAHWMVMRTKLLFDLVTDPAPVGNSEELLSVYTALGVRPRKDLEARGNKASTTDNYWRVQKGDIIVNKLLAWMGAVGISEYNGVTSPAYDILRARKNVNPYFYNYLFRNPIASREFKRHSRGIMDMRLRLYFTRLGDLKLPFPPIEEQNRIVEYLEFKLTKIDRFIKKKKQLIKLLNEQKAAIINRAVTKGLNPDAKMKPSGIGWLGDIPEHWVIKKIKHVADTFNGATPKSDNPTFWNGEINWVTPEDIGKVVGRKISNTTRSISFVGYESCGTRLVPIGAVVLTCRAPIGNIALAGIELCTNQGCKSLVPNSDVSGAYLMQFLIANRAILESFGRGTTFMELSNYSLKNLEIAFSPIESERIMVLEMIEDETRKFEKAIATIEKEIALTQEYRTALIAEAVTGKIDVRGYKMPTESGVQDYEEIEQELGMVAEDGEEYLSPLD
jgi:type I restriction enzyme S subunit